MKLYFAPMWYDDDMLYEEDIELFESIWNYIFGADPLGLIFDSHEIIDPIRIPPLEELEKRDKRSIFQRSSELIKFSLGIDRENISQINLIPYGYPIFGDYTIRYIVEVAEERKWDEIDGRVLALTNVFLSYRDITPGLNKIIGDRTSKKSVVISRSKVGLDPYKIYKSSKELLGYTLGLLRCLDDYCAMNTQIDIGKRSEHYCPTCREKILAKYGQ